MRKIKINGLVFLMLISVGCYSQKTDIKSLKENRMEVSWHYQNGRIYFEMIAPTEGWITIGFNTKQGTTGASLLMGRVVNGETEVVEYYTKSPGNYVPITNFGFKSKVENISGTEENRITTITFSLPTKAHSKYQKDLFEGNQYTLILAYSRDDDFQHHSIMRTSKQVKL